MSNTDGGTTRRNASIESGKQAGVRGRPDFESVYEQLLPVMVGVAVGRFGIAQTDAETLAHEVFVDFMQKHERVNDIRSWLVASIYRASLYYLRCRSRTEPLPPAFDESPDPRSLRTQEAWPDCLAARQAFECTTLRCQLALRLRYLEGYTIPEIATELKTTERYAAKLVGECLRQANRRYGQRAQVERAR